MKSEQLRLFQYSTFLTYLLVLEHSEFKTFLLDILDCSYKCPIAVYNAGRNQQTYNFPLSP